MNPKELREEAALILGTAEAYEVWHKDNSVSVDNRAGNTWYTSHPLWDDGVYYRLTPAPKTIPYENADWARLMLTDGCVKGHQPGQPLLVIQEVKGKDVRIRNQWWSLEEASEHFTQADGSPLTKEENSNETISKD